MYYLKYILLVICAFFFEACSENDDIELYFTGDSLVEGWDLQRDFPMWITHNKGIGGSKIDYIEDQKGSYSGKNVVVITGTNDLDCSSEKAIEDLFVERYITALKDLGANKIYLFSVFPRRDKDLNAEIKAFNEKICKAIIGTNIIYIDVFDRLCENGNLSFQYSYDGLHLNEYGYYVISSILKEYLNR